MTVLEINRNDINWSMGPMDSTCTRQERMKSYFVTGTYPNIKSGCHHYQIWMDYLYDTIFKMATGGLSGPLTNSLYACTL